MEPEVAINAAKSERYAGSGWHQFGNLPGQIALKTKDRSLVIPFPPKTGFGPHGFGAGGFQQHRCRGCQRAIFHRHRHQARVHGAQINQGAGKRQGTTDQYSIALLQTRR